MLSNYDLPYGLKIEQHYNKNEGNLNYNYRDNYDEECELYNEAIMMCTYITKLNQTIIKQKKIKQKKSKKIKKRKSNKIIL